MVMMVRVDGEENLMDDVCLIHYYSTSSTCLTVEG